MHHDVELSKKGEAYALRHNPTGCPVGIEPRRWRKALSRRVETHLALATALLSLLDGMADDCDLEDNGDHEPSLGGGTNAYGEYDLEGDESETGDLSWPETGPQVFRDTLGTEDDEDSDPDEHNGDVEPSLGFTENLDQAARLLVDPSSWPLDDGEEDIQDQPHDWDELEESIGSLAIQLPDGTIVNDREGSGMSLDGITDDHGICDSDALADVSLSFRPLGRHGGRQIAEQLLADHGS
jgi:hypothetical protein